MSKLIAWVTEVSTINFPRINPEIFKSLLLEADIANSFKHRRRDLEHFMGINYYIKFTHFGHPFDDGKESALFATIRVTNDQNNRIEFSFICDYKTLLSILEAAAKEIDKSERYKDVINQIINEYKGKPFQI